MQHPSDIKKSLSLHTALV